MAQILDTLYFGISGAIMDPILLIVSVLGNRAPLWTLYCLQSLFWDIGRQYFGLFWRSGYVSKSQSSSWQRRVLAGSVQGRNVIETPLVPNPYVVCFLGPDSILAV